MKKLFFCCLLAFAFTSYGQNSKIGLYIWKEVVMIQPSSLDGSNAKDNNGTDLPAIPSKSGQKFRVVAILSNKVIIQILDYTEKPTAENKKAKPAIRHEPTTDFYKYNFVGSATEYNHLTPEQINSRNYGSNQAYFSVSSDIVSDDNLVTKENRVGGALAAGVINFPFKYRPQKNNADFSGAFNFGAGIGYKFPHKSWRQFTYSVISGYSISNIVLDSSNANSNQGKLASTNNFTAFSFSLGFLAEYQSVQAGIFLGWDRIGKLNQKEFDWQYQGKPWISVGFGIAIFSGQKTKTDNSTASQTGN